MPAKEKTAAGIFHGGKSAGQRGGGGETADMARHRCSSPLFLPWLPYDQQGNNVSADKSPIKARASLVGRAQPCWTWFWGGLRRPIRSVRFALPSWPFAPPPGAGSPKGKRENTPRLGVCKGQAKR
jgi:hypothetical protein